MHVMVLTYGEPKKGYLNFTLGNLWATQPIALLIWPPLWCHILDSPNRFCAQLSYEALHIAIHFTTFPAQNKSYTAYRT